MLQFAPSPVGTIGVPATSGRFWQGHLATTRPTSCRLTGDTALGAGPTAWGGRGRSRARMWPRSTPWTSMSTPRSTSRRDRQGGADRVDVWSPPSQAPQQERGPRNHDRRSSLAPS